MKLLGLGSVIPPAHSVVEAAKKLGAKTENYTGWKNFCVADDAQQPGIMGAEALRLALEDAGCKASDLRLILSCGMSREYTLGWSVAAEIQKIVGAPPLSLGFDMMSGCLGVLIGLEVASNWLKNIGKGYAAVICSEKWSSFCDRSDEKYRELWPSSDGAAALVLGLNCEQSGFAEYLGAEFRSHPTTQGFIVIPYGGTKFPVPPDGESAYPMISWDFDEETDRAMGAVYVRMLDIVIKSVYKRFNKTASAGVCNQISSEVLDLICKLGGIPHRHFARTGNTYGHLGAADILVGLDHLRKHDLLKDVILVASTCPHAFGAGLLRIDN
jgi:3-oxoacyl-[acyl-carrier-protein] synthase III